MVSSLQVSLFSIDLLGSAYYDFILVRSLVQSIHVCLGQPCTVLPSNFPSMVFRSLDSIDPLRMCPPPRIRTGYL